MEVGNTSITRSMSVALAAAFILTIVSVPVTQHIIEIRAGFAESGRGSCRRLTRFQSPAPGVDGVGEPANGDLWAALKDANGVLMRGFQSYEEALESDLSLRALLFPHAQAFTAEFLGLGNEQVYLGRDRWLFYEPDVAYLTGPGFLSSSFQRSRGRAGIRARQKLSSLIR